MSEEKQIEEMAEIIKSTLDDLGSGNFSFTGDEISTMFAKALYNAGYRKQSEGEELRVEIDTESFENKALQAERGWYRKKFYCPNCDLLIKTESWDSKYMFGKGTVLKSNEMPNFCPKCGAKMKGGAE